MQRAEPLPILRRMNRFVALMFLSCLVFVPRVRAEGPEDQYIRIYNLIQEADSMLNGPFSNQALARYVEAEGALQRFQKSYPDWNPTVVKFRLNYLASRTGAAPRPAVLGKAPPPNGPGSQAKSAPPADWENQLNELQIQVRQLQAEKAVLEAKLKEALSVQPPAFDARELGKAEERIRALQKENDLLKVNLDKKRQTPGSQAASGNKEELEKQVAGLRAKLDAFEAQRVPYTTEELALLKLPEARLVQGSSAETSQPPAQKSVKELPREAAALVTEAKRYFAARQLDKAREKYLEALRFDPNNPFMLSDIANIELEMNRLTEAEKHIQQAEALAPEASYILSTVGHLKFRQDKHDEAIDVLSRAAKLDPQNAEIQNYLGIALSQKGLRLPAETSLRRAIQLEPGYGAAHHNLAVIYLNQQPSRVELARWHYQKALAAGHARNPDLEKFFENKKVAEVGK